MWSERKSTRSISQNYKVLRVQLNKIAGFLAVTLQKVSDPSKQQTAPCDFWNWSFNWCRYLTPSPTVGCVFRACLTPLHQRATKHTAEQPIPVLPKRMPCSEIPFQNYSCLRSRCGTGKCSHKQSQQQASCVGWKALYLPPSVSPFLHYPFPVCCKTCDFWSFSYRKQNNNGEVEVDWADQCH